MALILLCGLPASGKTSFANILKDKFNSSLTLDHFEFDKLCSKNTNDPTKWKHAQERFKAQVVARINEHRRHNQSEFLIIVDDTLHYSSMRRGCYLLDKTVALCQARNSERMERVSKSTIDKIAKEFEEPRQSEFGFNGEHGKILCLSSLKDINLGLEESIIEITSRLEFVLKHPLQSVHENNLKEASSDREKTKVSKKHHVDQQMRAMVSKAITQYTSDWKEGEREISEICKDIAKARSSTLKTLRTCKDEGSMMRTLENFEKKLAQLTNIFK